MRNFQDTFETRNKRSFISVGCTFKRSTYLRNMIHKFKRTGYVNKAKWLSVRLRTKWLWVRVPLQSLRRLND